MQVRVQNLNSYPYKERFRDRDIVIEPNSDILMDEDEADYLMGTFVFPVKDSQGRPDPKFFKKLKIHPDDLKALRDSNNKSSMVCHANGQKAVSQEELAKILSNFQHMLAPTNEDGEAEAVKKQNSALRRENKELKSRLELIEEKLGLGASQNVESL